MDKLYTLEMGFRRWLFRYQ